MSSPSLSIPLSDGNALPCFGSSAFRKDSIDLTVACVKSLVDAGIRHFEISELFGNGHTIVDTLVSQLRIPRNELYITFKCWPKDSRGVELKQRCKAAIEGLGLASVDLLLIHAPIDVDNRIDQYKELEALQAEGLVRSFGLCNYSSEQITSIFKYCSIAPAVIETEVSPFCLNSELTDFCGDSSIAVLNNNPFNKGLRLNHPELVRIANELDMCVEQVLIRWAYNKGYAVVIPAGPFNAGVNYNNVNNNGNYSENGQESENCVFQLPIEHMRALEALDEDLKTRWIPAAKDDDE